MAGGSDGATMRTPPRLLALVLLGILWLAPRSQAAAPFVVGAAAVDVTPPLAADAPTNPANCDTTGTYAGPHLFSLEEPYQDVNGNGKYDAGDPTDPSVFGPEPFLDCPTPTADGAPSP